MKVTCGRCGAACQHDERCPVCGYQWNDRTPIDTRWLGVGAYVAAWTATMTLIIIKLWLN